jgi:hypothetical protein
MKAALVTISLLWLLVSSTPAESAVYFADPRLKATVEAELWVTNPTATDMLELTSLNIGTQGITDLTGLEYALNLYSLQATHNQISDLSPLSGLSNLETLALNTNQIGDLSPLAGLSNLRDLNLHDNPISDISPLSGLTNLQSLTLRINNISDISALSGLTNLETLALEDNQVSDIAPLSGLSNLRYLRLGYNEISALSPLSGLSDLDYLDVHKNRITDISALSSLSNLDTLILENNQISDISPVAGFTGLSRLDLRSNPLNQEAYDVHIPQLLAANPGIYLKYDEHVGRYLSVSSTVGGSVINPGEGDFTYEYDEMIRLEAKADPCFVFVNWSGSYSSIRNPLYLTMDQDHQVRASFVSVLEVLHVDDDAPADLWPGDPTRSDPLENGTAGHPFDSIQEAIEVAVGGSSIIVQTGTYRENIDFLGKDLRLMGMDPSDAQRSPWPVIEGAAPGPVVRWSCLLTGFVITGGQGPPAGAVLCEGASPTIANCLIVGNRSTGADGAAVRCTESWATLTNCTIADNDGGKQGAALTLVDSNVALVNSILWGNSPDEILTLGTSEPSVRYCDVRGGWWDVENLNLDPLFARRGYWASPSDPNVVLGPQDSRAVWVPGDYHLKSRAGRWDPDARAWVADDVTSPCIDRGDRTYRPASEPQPNGGVINMGAYGGTTQAGKSTVGP